MPKKKKNEWSMIFDNGDDASFDYREPDDDGSVDEILKAAAYRNNTDEEGNDGEEYEEVWEPEYNDKMLISDCPYCGGAQTIHGTGGYLKCDNCGEYFSKSTISLFSLGIITRDEALRRAGYVL